jgi:cytochrome P450
LTAGFETTTNLITNAIDELLARHDVRADLLADPSMAAPLVEEVLRFVPPVHMSRPRTFKSTAVFGGVELGPGDSAVTVVAAANRDPDAFDDPDQFDPRRTPNRHLTFGFGPHLCVGAALARLEAQTAVTRIFQRYPDLRLDGTPTMRPNLLLRGFGTYPVSVR